MSTVTPKQSTTLVSHCNTSYVLSHTKMFYVLSHTKNIPAPQSVTKHQFFPTNNIKQSESMGNGALCSTITTYVSQSWFLPGVKVRRIGPNCLLNFGNVFTNYRQNNVTFNIFFLLDQTESLLLLFLNKRAIP